MKSLKVSLYYIKAAENDHLIVFKLLLNHGANYQILNMNGKLRNMNAFLETFYLLHCKKNIINT